MTVITYTHDGNLLTDGSWTYAWDAENRLIEQFPHLDTFVLVVPTKVRYDYDYMNRMVRRRTYLLDGEVWSDTPATDQRYVYDGWRVIEELNGMDDNAVTLQFTWGLDLSGQNGASRAVPGPGTPPGLDSAGGIGGLLAMHKNEGIAPGDTGGERKGVGSQ